jgi:hypothetical protein
MPTVASVSPANGATTVLDDAPVTVELTRTDSTDYVKVETTQADFAAGTLAQVVAGAAGELVLAEQAVINDTFAADTIGALPAGWTAYQGTGAFQVASIDSQNAVRSSHAPTTDFAIQRTAPTVADLDVYLDINSASSANDVCVWLRVVGPWATRTGYQISFHWATNTIQLDRRVSGSNTSLASPSFTWAINTWYTVRVQISGTAIKARAWVRGTAEPSTWTLNTTDSVITAAGNLCISTYYGNVAWIDNIRTVNQTQAYLTPGSRVSPPYALAAVGVFGTGIVEYDATLPAGTTLTVKISKDGTNWTTVASGDRIALWAEGDSLAAANIYVKAELATTDTGATPVLSEVRLIFTPFDPADVELDVDGNAFTTGNGKLLWNGSYSRAVFRSVAQAARWGDVGDREGAVTFLVKYGGSTLSTTTLYVGWTESVAGPAEGFWFAVMGSMAWMHGRASGYYYVINNEQSLLLAAANGYYYVVGETPCEADGFYWIAHPFFRDTPEAFVAGQPHTRDFPEALIVNGYNPHDYSESLIVQGWIRADQPEALAVGNPFLRDHGPEAVIVAREQIRDLPEGTVVYEVNRHNGMSIRIMTVEEAALLAELGVLVVD